MACENDQNIKADAGKPELTLVPRKIMTAIAYVRSYGVKKYKTANSWREVDIQRYRDATFRHWLKYLDDPQGLDEESGLPHLWHFCANASFLCEMEDLAGYYKANDPPLTKADEGSSWNTAGHYLEHIKNLREQALEIIDTTPKAVDVMAEATDDEPDSIDIQSDDTVKTSEDSECKDEEENTKHAMANKETQSLEKMGTRGRKIGIDKNAMAQMYKDGMGTSHIAKELGCSTGNVTAALKKMGIWENRKPIHKHSKIDKGRVKALYEAGRSISWIADDIGAEPQEVGQVVKQLHEQGEIA